ncbi:histidine kinase [Dyadobacter sp. CY356]|uniref:histidine kinase n=1 Tax=Dyadobacter sp. CY356 TaxID=2906442 RepID=UPI001F46289C|nr:histidine kinase [Dyadobacter sp. CY356]MCF0055005.1 histidine kinase [Dyadobacter sp. CY356]
MKRLLFLLFLLPFFVSCKSDMVYEEYPVLYKNGDNILWAGKHYNDSDWSANQTSNADSVFWVRTHINILKNPDAMPGIKVNAFGAFEVYWDSVRIGSNGRIFQKNILEIPGTEATVYNVPDSLSGAGMHILSFRASQSYLPKEKRGFYVELDSYKSLLTLPLVITSVMNIMSGAFLIASLYYFFLYFNSSKRQQTILIFAVICLLFFTLLILEYIKFYIEIPYTKFYFRLEAIGILTIIIAILVPLYFTIQFNFQWKKVLLVILGISLIGIYIFNYRHYDRNAQYYSMCMWIASTVIVLNAILQKEKGALLVLSGLLCSIVVNKYVVYDFGLFISFTIIVLCMLYLHTIRSRVIEDEYHSSLLLSSRLQLELVKKNIQPHFLKNTLTSLIDWVEESPKQGAEFIHALAAEFDIMNTISEEVQIPIRQEIELCKVHLTVMQFRKEIQYHWEDKGIDDAEFIPPALIHTILENGITHSIPIAGHGIRFCLQFLKTNTYRQYTFETIAENRIPSRTRKGGTGFRYIQARLTESYGDKWEFTSEATPNGWMSTVKIYTK